MQKLEIKKTHEIIEKQTKICCFEIYLHSSVPSLTLNHYLVVMLC